MSVKNKSKWLIVSVVGLFLIAVVVGFLFYKRAKAVSGDVAIKLPQSTTSATSWEIVQHLTGRDILKEQNVTLDFIPAVGAGTPLYQPLLSGVYDLGQFDWTGWITVTKAERTGILVLDESDIHSIKDLKGKTIGVNILGLGAEYTIKIFLEKNGLALSQVQLLQVPVENEEQALRTHQIDAAAGTTSGGSWFERALDRGGVHVIPGTKRYDVYGHDATIFACGFRDDFIAAHPDTVRHYVTAVETAKRVIWDAFQKDPEHVRKIVADITTEKGGNPQLVKYYLPANPESTLIKDSDIQFWIDLFVKDGKLQRGQIKPSDVYTNLFNPFARNN